MKTILSWSGGKDSAWTLNVPRQDPALEVAGRRPSTSNLMPRRHEAVARSCLCNPRFA
jgi:diphthamide synthase (EF-2-diphthine--ammonia ligase)